MFIDLVLFMQIFCLFSCCSIMYPYLGPAEVRAALGRGERAALPAGRQGDDGQRQGHMCIIIVLLYL